MKEYGWDIDKNAVKQCVENLNQIIAPYNLQIQWKIEVKDSLKEIENVKESIFSVPADRGFN